jgi:spore coat protein JC
MLFQLLDGATPEELEKEGLGTQYTENGLGIYPKNSDGVPFTAAYFAVTGDPLADLAEDMAAEQKARATYENLMNLTNDPDILEPLSFLRQREIIHYERFKQLYEEYAEKILKDKSYLI